MGIKQSKAVKRIIFTAGPEFILNPWFSTVYVVFHYNKSVTFFTMKAEE